MLRMLFKMFKSDGIIQTAVDISKLASFYSAEYNLKKRTFTIRLERYFLKHLESKQIFYVHIEHT